jgi:hypothetical protein
MISALNQNGSTLTRPAREFRQDQNAVSLSKINPAESLRGLKNTEKTQSDKQAGVVFLSYTVSAMTSKKRNYTEKLV